MSLCMDTRILRPTYQESGHIYCIVNKSYEDWVKVGMSKNPGARLKQYNNYAPEDNFYFLELEKVDYYKLAEQHLIQTFTKYTSESLKEEWFQTTQDKAKIYFSETVDTLEQYIHTSCIKEVNRIRAKKEYRENKRREYALQRDKARKKKRDEARRKKRKQNKIEKKRRIQQHMALIKLLTNLELLNANR